MRVIRYQVAVERAALVPTTVPTLSSRVSVPSVLSRRAIDSAPPKLLILKILVLAAGSDWIFSRNWAPSAAFAKTPFTPVLEGAPPVW